MLTCATVARLDVVLLVGDAFLRVYGGMVDIVVHVSQGTDGVEQQFVAVLALYGHEPIAPVSAPCDVDVRLAVLGRPAAATCCIWSGDAHGSAAKMTRQACLAVFVYI